MGRARTPIALVVIDRVNTCNPGTSHPAKPAAHLPVATDDAIKVALGKTRLWFAPGVLANDNGQQLTASLLAADPNLATAQVSANGTLTVQSDDQVAAGEHWLYYLVTDENGLQAIGRVLVSVAEGTRDIVLRLQGQIAGGVERTIDLNSGEASIVTDETGEGSFHDRLSDRDHVMSIGDATPVGNM